MKTIAKNMAAALIVGAALLIGCEKENLTPVSQENSMVKKAGDTDFRELKWRVVHFLDKNNDYADKFKNYFFIFHKNGILEVTDGRQNFQGRWKDSGMTKPA